MKAHIVGGGFAGLAAAALLIRNANVLGPDITIYEAEDKLGGGFFLDGDAEHGYNLPGSIFDKEFRCALDLLAAIPTQGYSNINVAEQFLTFNNEHPFERWTRRHFHFWPSPRAAPVRALARLAPELAHTWIAWLIRIKGLVLRSSSRRSFYCSGRRCCSLPGTPSSSSGVT
jgi:phytoene dehydrogenase-like protein